MGVVDGVEEDLSAGGHVSDLDGTLEEGGVAAGGLGGAAGAAVGVVREAALLQRLAAVRGRLSLCADQAAAAKWGSSQMTV